MSEVDEDDKEPLGPCVLEGGLGPQPGLANWKGANPLDSFDARVWAKEFMRSASGYTPGTEGHRIMEETVVGWFANALMRGYDERRWKMEKDKSPGEPCAPTIEERVAWLEGRFEELEEQTENLAWGLKNEAKRAAGRDNELASGLGRVGELRDLVSKLQHRVRCAQGESAKVRGETNARLLVVERKLRELTE